ncbi:MAG: glutathione S-transferase family protein [Pseudomonadota bacterium]
MLTIHHLGVSQSERIVWLCEELGLPYELKRYVRRADNSFAPDEYKALHPAQTAPIITDGALSLAESGAICDYIVTRYGGGRLVPAPDSPDFAHHLFWFHFSNGSFMAILLADLALTMAGVVERPQFVQDRKERAWALANAHLQQHPWFGGSDISSADIMMGFVLTTMLVFSGTTLERYPAIEAYVQRIKARPAYQRAMAAAEPEGI